MALIYKYRTGYRVVFTLKLPDNTLRRQKYPKTKSEANVLRRQVERLEEAVRTGLAGYDDIAEWIGRDWLKEEEAIQAFRGFRESQSMRRPETVPIDLDAILAEYEAYAITNSKARDAGRKTHQNHMSLAKQVLGWLAAEHPALDLTEEDVRGWLERLRAKGYSDWSVRHNLTKLRLLLDQAIKLRMIHVNVARDVAAGQPKNRETRRLITPEEAQHILEVSLNYRQRISGGLPTVVRLGLYAGLRNEEMCWCTWNWIEMGRGILHVQPTTAPHGETWDPKDLEVRRLDIKQELVDFLKDDRKRQKKEKILGPFILPGGHWKKTQYRQRPLLSDKLQRAFAEMIKAEKMDERITVYSLRHTYATSLLRAGVDIKTVQQRLGHADVRTTMGYLHEIEPEQHPTDALPY